MEEKIENRGGRREGSGRKKRDKDVKPVLLNLELDLYEAFPKGLNRNAYFNEAIRKKMQEDGLI